MRMAVILVVLLSLAACARPPVTVQVDGGSSGGLDWRIGLPF